MFNGANMVKLIESCLENSWEYERPLLPPPPPNSSAQKRVCGLVVDMGVMITAVIMLKAITCITGEKEWK